MKISRNELAKLLLELSKTVAAGDSFEGNFGYEMLDENIFEIIGGYRFGNLEGQGSTRIFELSKPEQKIA